MLVRNQQADSYSARSYWLKQMGFANYEEYLLSPLWAKVRRKVILRAKGKCVSCGGCATQVHHERYHRNDLLGKNLRFLKAVCGTCHQAIEFTWRNPKKLLRAYEIRNRVVHNLRDQLVEILGKDDAYEMINEAEKDAEKWWEGRRNQLATPSE